jgi:predicted GIY-YIG superfamily endonuclease
VAPPEQQKRIVAKIEELFSHIDAGIAALNKAKQLLKQYRQSVLKAAVTGELTKHLPSRQAGWRDPLFRNKCGKLVPKNSDKYFAYVLECENGSLYKGFSKNLYMRIDQHLSGQGAKWTKEHKPVSIIHFEEFETEKEAIEREKYFKSGSGREWINEIRTENNRRFEPASQLLERILQERRQKWEAQQLEQFKAKGKVPKDDGWKGKYKEPLAFDTEFEVPEDWIVCSFEQLILELKNGISKKPSEDQGLAILRISAVRPMVVYNDDVRFLPENFDSKGFEIEDGDLLFTRYNGNPEFVGVCGKVKVLENKTVYPDKLMRARPVSTKKLCTDYLELSLNCGISKDFMRSVPKTTAGQSGVAGGDVKKCPTVLPPYEEQVEIANIVSEKIESMKRLDIELNIHLTKAGKNKQSILASAFSGKLNCRVNSADET